MGNSQGSQKHRTHKQGAVGRLTHQSTHSVQHPSSSPAAAAAAAPTSQASVSSAGSPVSLSNMASAPGSQKQGAAGRLTHQSTQTEQPPSSSSAASSAAAAAAAAAAASTTSKASVCLAGQSSSQPGPLLSPVQQAVNHWLSCIKEWYPKRRTKTYFLPPQFFRRQQFGVVNIGNQSVLVPEKPSKKAQADMYPPGPSQPQPAQPQTAQPQPAQSQAAQPQPAQFQAAQPQPAQSQAAQPQPAQSHAAQPQPAQFQAAQPQPVQSQAAQPQPAQSQAAQPQPGQVAGTVYTLPQGQPAPLPQFQQSDFIDDDAAERLLTCLRVIGDKNTEGMVVISQLEFRKYLDNETDPLEMLSNEEADKMKTATDAACAGLPRADTLGPKHRDGDFDVLVVHSELGLLVMEVKAVGADAANIPDLSTALRGKVSKALTQLHKYPIVLRHMTSDMPAPINVIKVLVLPYVTETQLRQALEDDRLDPGRQQRGDKLLEEELCDQLGSDDLSVALSRCLLADRMPTMKQLGLLAVRQFYSDSDSETGSDDESSDGVSSDAVTADPSSKAEAMRMVDKLQDWWRDVTVCSNGPRPHLSEADYDQLLARFCGPATSVEIPTVTAPRLALPTRNKKNKKGASQPSYTPATKVLRTVCQAVAETGLILSTLTLYPDQVNLLNNPNLNNVFIHAPPGTGKTVVLFFKASQWLHQGHNVLVLCTQSESRAASFLIERQIQQALGPNPPPHPTVLYRYIERKVSDDGKGLIWSDNDVKEVAAMARNGTLHIIADEIPWRIFPALLNKLHAKVPVPALSVWCGSIVSMNPPPSWMSTRELSVPLRSPPTVTEQVKQSAWINGSITPQYSQPDTPVATRGPEVEWLDHTSHTDHSNVEPQNCPPCCEWVVQLLDEFRVGHEGADLQHRDVFILSWDPSPTDLVVTTLQSRDVPVKVVKEDASDNEVRDMALAVRDEVTISDSDTVSGLERRLVIVMDMNAERSDRLLAMSRSTAQLCCIKTKDNMPFFNDDEEGEDEDDDDVAAAASDDDQ